MYTTPIESISKKSSEIPSRGGFPVEFGAICSASAGWPLRPVMELLMNYTRILKRAGEEPEPLALGTDLLPGIFQLPPTVEGGVSSRIFWKYFIGKVCAKWLLKGGVGRDLNPNSNPD